MAKTRPSVQKRLKEARALDKKQQKEARRAQREALKAERPDVADHIDPDLVGITPGPQAVPWHEREENRLVDSAD